MSGYFNLSYNPRTMADELVHSLNRPYRGAKRFDVTAPDAPGTLRVFARDERELADHLRNALFDLIFHPNRVGAHVANPRCIFCGARTESRGRNSSGTRTWRCLSAECRRSFVLDRTFRGGINHPTQSKKPKFAQLVLQGMPIAEAARAIGLNVETAKNWGAQIEAANKERFAELKCGCGKPLRHRGQCGHRIASAQAARKGAAA